MGMSTVFRNVPILGFIRSVPFGLAFVFDGRGRGDEQKLYRSTGVAVQLEDWLKE